MDKKNITFKIIIFTIKSILLLLVAIYILFTLQGARLSYLYSAISIGMTEVDVVATLGKPNRVFYHTDYMNAVKKGYEPGGAAILKLPITNKVYEYQYFDFINLSGFLFVFFDDNNKVSMTCYCNSDRLPFWYGIRNNN